MSGFLDGKTIVIMGVANKRSIAWGCTQAIIDQGAKVILTYQNDRIKKSLQRFVPEDSELVECDVADDDNIKNAFEEIGNKYGKIDGVIHAIAYADRETLTSGLVHTTREGYDLAQNISAYSLIAVSRYAQPILNDPSSIVTLTYFGSTRAIPNYNMMGVAKAALEANVRYLASDLGVNGIRVNAISAGAVKTLAVTGIKHHGELLKESESRTVDQKSVTTTEIGNVAAFLMSDLATGMTGDVVYVDKGVHLI
ncbi:MAG: enoyl-ACP reductase FabI [Lentilactobacillus diolivorans]|jgi:enoyl-[acyl-carrier protein] reductase I|uniref:Enoyl-[acyl-carrier-protein] reductase [NADH] n=6 Tax=Lactobacillaceae TaxID=33958 RepID=A0A4R5NMQ0_9LACO|nr:MULTISPECIES: enoyl-ACP reductase FabI [Lactobacillaceae]RRG00937.1 MAG: enoyl-[acyl-carrier-protein] reductase FabI [Lactobacillus sp.]AMV68319.1 Enoyl-[acyl-carrier-protein] reductase (NADH) [Pediococcus damnosus]ANK68540.1 enoyl-ACP reductase [Loigolactobacillus backii]KRL62612.1 enoyl-(acyl carrier protein) reductase [Lentilactobacillus diolivorans DSM 14421]KRM57165.1 enoyl-(acyl carrier protein) reductase [Secundilactobacillus malefermentans DSM 5705 = KCTC 3548]